jgi:hypothetical protein
MHPIGGKKGERFSCAEGRQMMPKRRPSNIDTYVQRG